LVWFRARMVAIMVAIFYRSPQHWPHTVWGLIRVRSNTQIHTMRSHADD
jgi:hypothetical protein